MSKASERGDMAGQLLKSETLQAAIAEIRGDQVAVFLNIAATSEDREKAHNLVCAITQLENCLARWVSDSSIEKQREQDRNGD